jgi:hypothetical protein
MENRIRGTSVAIFYIFYEHYLRHDVRKSLRQPETSGRKSTPYRRKRNTKFINNSRGAIMKKVILIFLLMLTSMQIFADCYRGDRAYPTSATVGGMRCGADGYWH